MSSWLQNLIVLLLVAGAASYVIWQGIRSLSGRRSRLGQCCSKGCGSAAQTPAGSPQPAVERIVFMPVEMLSRRRK